MTRPCSGCGLWSCDGIECYLADAPDEPNAPEKCDCGESLDEGECAICDRVMRELRATIEMQDRTGAMPSAPALVLRTAPLRVAAVPASIRIAGDI